MGLFTDEVLPASWFVRKTSQITDEIPGHMMIE